MTPLESLVDSWVDRAVKHYGRSQDEIKKHCVIAGHVVGKYQISGSLNIADKIGRSVSTVENHAHAYWMYAELRKMKRKQIKTVRKMWRTLSATHWWTAWEQINNIGYDPYTFLVSAEAHNQSVTVMMKDFAQARKDGNAPLKIDHAKNAFYGLASELRRFGVTCEAAHKIVDEAYK